MTLEYTRSDPSFFEAASHALDESFIRSRLQKSPGKFNVVFVASHGQAGGRTKSARHDENGLELVDFRNDIFHIETKRHGRFLLSRVPFAITAEHIVRVAIEPALLVESLLETLASAVDSNLGGGD
jgi:hypothetical protein